MKTGPRSLLPTLKLHRTKGNLRWLWVECPRCFKLWKMEWPFLYEARGQSRPCPYCFKTSRVPKRTPPPYRRKYAS